MCDLSSETSSIKTGYKMVAMKDGKFYSSFTSQELKPGKVEEAKYYNPLADWVYSHIFERETISPLQLSNLQSFFKKDFKGYTAAFLNECDAVELLMDKSLLRRYRSVYELMIVKITFSGKVLQGQYNEKPIIAGKYIESIKTISS
jgi:hypothetical protein